MNKRYQVSFLPWAGFKQTIKIGQVTFLPYYGDGRSMIQNTELEAFLDRYFRSYVNYSQKPVDIIILCVYGAPDFYHLNPEEYLHLRNVVDALIFSSISPDIKIAVCSNNETWGPTSSNIFELITHNINLSKDYNSVEAGSLLVGGLKIGEFFFSEPWARGRFCGAPEDKLVTNKCIK